MIRNTFTFCAAPRQRRSDAPPNSLANIMAFPPTALAQQIYPHFLNLIDSQSSKLEPHSNTSRAVIITAQPRSTRQNFLDILRTTPPTHHHMKPRPPILQMTRNTSSQLSGEHAIHCTLHKPVKPVRRNTTI